MFMSLNSSPQLELKHLRWYDPVPNPSRYLSAEPACRFPTLPQYLAHDTHMILPSLAPDCLSSL